MNDLEENINPDEWTQKELIKHLYRELKKLSRDMEAVKNWAVDQKRIDRISAEISQIHQTVRELEKIKERSQWTIAVLATVAGILGSIIGVASKIMGLF